MENQLDIIQFEESAIRKIWHEGEWWFAVVDVIQFLTDTKNPKRYLSDLKRRDPELDREGGTKISYPLPMPTKGGTQRINCANTEGLLRLAMSITSPKVEPLKKWLAKTGSERIEEELNPEMGFERLREIYKQKGYPDDWIDRRLQTIEVRKQLTDEWKSRGVKEGQEYAILTAAVAKGTFGLTPSEHSALKGLEKENLRDHMSNFELIFTALSEEITRSVTIKEDANGFEENREAAAESGKMAGEARENLEKRLGQKIVSAQNFLDLNNNQKAIAPKDDEK